MSDLRVMLEPLDKWQCRMCGAIRRRSVNDVAKLFESDYDLYAHDPGRALEAFRQAGYASWLAEQISAPASCFEAGSGNGSLLLALREHWNAAMSGVEPAQDAAAAARRACIAVATGYVQTADATAPRAWRCIFGQRYRTHRRAVRIFAYAGSHGERSPLSARTRAFPIANCSSATIYTRCAPNT